MATTQHARHHLHQCLDDALGSEAAETLMDHLPVGGAEALATKADVESVRAEVRHLEQRLDVRFARIDDRFAHVDDRFDLLVERMDERFERMDERFERMDERFERMDERFEGFGDRFDGLGAQIRAEMYKAQRDLVITMISALCALAALGFGLARLG